jgi:hypothetical protein
MSAKRVLDDAALAWAQRGVWALCIAVYLTVFIGGVTSHGDELMTMARAIATALAAGVLGKIAVGLLARASLREESGPSANQDGPVGSLADLVASTNVAQHEDTAESALD